MEIENIKTGIWTAGLGAFAMFGIGFGVLGWVFGGTAQEQTAAAVVERLTPICIAQAKSDSTSAGKIKILEKMEYDKRGAFVASQGWATMPGEKAPDGAVAEKCSDQITG
jgi:hypothetical protein